MTVVVQEGNSSSLVLKKKKNNAIKLSRPCVPMMPRQSISLMDISPRLQTHFQTQQVDTTDINWNYNFFKSYFKEIIKISLLIKKDIWTIDSMSVYLGAVEYVLFCRRVLIRFSISSLIASFPSFFFFKQCNMQKN